MKNFQLTEYRRDITNKIIEALKKGTVPWRQPWFGDCSPVNAVTGNKYKGMNFLILYMMADELDGGNDPRWCTYLQAKANGWNIKKGSKGTRITFWKVIESEQDESLDDDSVAISKNIPVMKFFTVFHASQIEGIAPYLPEKVIPIVANKNAEDIILNSGADIRHNGFKAFYSPIEDFIQIPKRDFFLNTDVYYSTLFHELAHWTGHHTRLNRTLSANKYSNTYAMEELIAEISSMFLNAEAGISQTQEHFDNHAGYISSWISLLSSDFYMIFKATSEAEKVVDWLLRFKSKNPESNDLSAQ